MADALLLDAPDDIIQKLEKQMMKGRGRWVADFNESFLDYRVGDVSFDLFILGNTRVRGFILSRLFSFLLNPNYEVGFFAITTGDTNEVNSRRIRKWILATKSCMRKCEMKWAWLLLVGKALDESGEKCVQEATDRDVGVAYWNTNSGQIVSADTYLGRQLKRYVKI